MKGTITLTIGLIIAIAAFLAGAIDSYVEHSYFLFGFYCFLLALVLGIKNA